MTEKQEREQELKALYGPNARFTKAKDIKVGTRIVMTMPVGSKVLDCTPVVTVKDLGHEIFFLCKNHFDYHMNPESTIITG